MHSAQYEFAEAAPEQTDKVERHGYHRFYPWFLREFRGRPIRLLEIGIDQLGSVNLWRTYFKAGLELHGIDRDKKTFEDSSVHLHKVDQSKLAELKRFVESTKDGFDVIVDDGSHIPEHQLQTLESLWPILSPGGVYILEDIETSFWGKSELYGYLFDARRSTQNVVGQLLPAVDAVNAEFLSHKARHRLATHRLGAVLMDIEMISFGQNCIVLLKKDAESFGRYYGRSYRFAYKFMNQLKFHRVHQHLHQYGMRGLFTKALQKLFRPWDARRALSLTPPP
jgi:hypothetical protein